MAGWFSLKEPQVRWLLKPTQAAEQFAKRSAAEIKARGMNPEKMRNWKTTEEMEEAAWEKVEKVKAGEAEEAAKDSETSANARFVSERARWEKPEKPTAKSGAKAAAKSLATKLLSPAKAATARSPSGQQHKIWAGASPKRRPRSGSPATPSAKAEVSSSELAGLTGATAAVQDESDIVRGADAHLL